MSKKIFCNKFYSVIVVLTYVLIIKPSSASAAIFNSESSGKILRSLLYAADTAGYENLTNETAGSGGVILLVATGVQIFISLIGIYFMIMLIYAGFTWMTAQGDKDKVAKAQTIARENVIGLAIVIAAYLITYTVLYYVGGAIGVDTGLK